MARQFTLQKQERLKSRKQIELLFKIGKSFHASPYKIYFHIDRIGLPHKSTRSNIKFGVGVSSKQFKKAVDRNRIKRITREAYRLQKDELQDVLTKNSDFLNVFFIYTARDIEDFNAVKLKVGVALKRLVQIFGTQESK